MSGLYHSARGEVALPSITDKVAEDEVTAKKRGGFSQGALIRRGWTHTLISKVLGWADYLVENPYYSSGASMHLYDVDRVHRIEIRPEFMSLRRAAHRKSKTPDNPQQAVEQSAGRRRKVPGDNW